ncbi:hypothetical protein [Helicobacter bizzozeronii]|uniref:hypothetical protein n=1 Tax=Helicobacter bizzozeronii TaxID=56877 RepID=UPI000CF0522D|nr:hypothetical protein [Helicobacter bizzozeronii]
MANQEQTRKELEGILAKWRTRVLAFFDGLALEVLRTHFIAFDRLLAGVDKRSSLFKDISNHQVAIFKYIRWFYEKWHALEPKAQNQEQMQECLAQTLKDSLEEFKENVCQSVVSAQMELKQRLAIQREKLFLAQCATKSAIPHLEYVLKQSESRQFELALHHFIALYAPYSLKIPR